MPGRNFTAADGYRYGFNGYEKDDEVKGANNHLDFEGYGYDPRVGRRLNMDPLWKAFPYQSPYVYALNNPVRFVDVEGEGPGDGTMRLYVTKTTLKINGANQTIYLKKRYYENATPEQVRRFENAALTSNGWYMSSEAEYEQFQKDPSQGAFKSKIYGADTPSEKRMLGEPAGGFIGQPLDVLGTKSGVINFKTSGVDSEGNDVTQAISFSILDEKGNIVSSEEYTTTGKADLDFEYNLEEGQSVSVNTSGGASHNEVSLYTKEKKGDRAPDNINQYGKESPTNADIKQIVED